MSSALDALIKLLTIESQGGDHFRGIGSSDDGAPVTYGGHFLGQATAAVLETVSDDRLLHSLHGYFLRPGRPQEVIDYQVERVRDGGTFSTRRVKARQGESVVFEMLASFAKLEEGEVLEATPPADFTTLPSPETLPSYRTLMERQQPLPFPQEWALREHAVEIRPVNAPWAERGLSFCNGIRMWIRANGELPDNPKLHTAILAYQSDESISDNILMPFKVTWGSPGIFTTSLDHAMWFHRPLRIDEWLFVDQSPICVAHGRGLSNATVWNQAQELVASFTQEALYRKQR